MAERSTTGDTPRGRLSEIRIATSLRNAPREPKTPAEIDAECRRAWLERGVVVILDVEAVPNEWARAAILGEATRLYGRRAR